MYFCQFRFPHAAGLIELLSFLESGIPLSGLVFGAALAMLVVLEWSILISRVLYGLFGVCIFLTVTLAVYRMTLHPLAKFPGPKLAAATAWYETYYDCLLLGKFSNHIDKLHNKYGKNCSLFKLVTLELM